MSFKNQALFGWFLLVATIFAFANTAESQMLPQPRAGLPRPIAEYNFIPLNTVVNSDAVSWSPRGSASVTANVANPLAPDGTATAELFQGIDTGTNTNDIFYQRASFGAVYKTAFEPSFYIKRVSTSGVLSIQNPATDTYGKWLLDLSLLSDNWEVITKDHPAVTVQNNFRSNIGRHGIMFKKESGDGTLSFNIWRMCIVANSSPANTPLQSGAQTTFADLSGNGNTVTLGATPPTVVVNGLSFDGVNDFVTGIPDKGAAWTVITFSSTTAYGVDSAGGSYIDGVATAGAIEPNIETAATFSGVISGRWQFDRVLTAAEEAAVYKLWRRFIGSRYPWVAGGVVTFTFDDGYSTDYEKGEPLFTSKGVVANIAVVSDNIGTADHMSATQIQTLAGEGWGVLSHTKTHPDLRSQSVAQLQSEFGDSKTAIEALIGQQVKFVVYPNGLYNATVTSVADDYYTLGRKSLNSINYSPNDMDWFEWRSWVADDHTKLAEYEAAVDAAFTGRGWLDFHLHQMTDADVTTIGQLIDYILAKGMPIVSWDDALEIITNPLLR